MVTLSASTLGAPGEDLDQVLGTLQRARIPGLELRLSVGELADPAMSRAQRRALRTAVEDVGMTVTGVASYVRVGSEVADDLVLGALVGALDLAADLGAPFVRVFPGAPAEPCGHDTVPTLTRSRAEVADRAARRLDAVAGFAKEAGVRPVLETHDSHPTGALVAEVLGRVSSPMVGAVWDLMHPWRVGEPLAETWAAIGPWVADGRGFVQVKDAALPEHTLPVPLGEGTLPLDPFAVLLTEVGYDGVVSLEWERAWYPDAAPLAVAGASFRRWADAAGLSA